MTLRKAFDGEVYYWYEDAKSRQVKSRVTAASVEAGRDVMANEKDFVVDEAMSSEQLARAALIAESRGIDLETAQELVYLRDRAAINEDLHQYVSDGLGNLANASYTELRSSVETNREYTPEPHERFDNETLDTKHFKFYATKEEWAVAEKVSGWFQERIRIILDKLTAAATAAPKVSNDLLRDAGAIIIVNEGSAGARVEIRFAELQDAQRLHQALAQMRVAAPVDHNSIPLIGYERILTIEWDKYNARRHELIKAERSRVLSESEVLELFELQWLARIKHGLSSGPRVTQKQALPDHFLCINPEEQPIVINFLRGYGTDAERELARLHLNLCLRCQELANAAPVEQSDSSIPTCPDCQQGYICERCGKSIIDYYSGNEGAR